MLEEKLEASRLAWFASIERFSKIIEDQLEQARAESPNSEEVRLLEEVQLKILRMWKRHLPNAPEKRRDERGVTRWISRKPDSDIQPQADGSD